MTAERNRSAPILDLLRQAYPRLPNLSFAGQAYTKPNLHIRDCLTPPGLSSPCQASPNLDCQALPCIACTRRTETCQDCHNKPHASGTSPTAHCRAPPRLPNQTTSFQSGPEHATPFRDCLAHTQHTSTFLYRTKRTSSQAFITEPYATVEVFT